MGSTFKTLNKDNVSYQPMSNKYNKGGDGGDKLEESNMWDDANGIGVMHTSPQEMLVIAALEQLLSTTLIILPHSEETKDKELINISRSRD